MKTGPFLWPATSLDKGKTPRIQEACVYVKRWDSQEGFLLNRVCLAIWIPDNNLSEIFSLLSRPGQTLGHEDGPENFGIFSH